MVITGTINFEVDKWMERYCVCWFCKACKRISHWTLDNPGSCRSSSKVRSFQHKDYESSDGSDEEIGLESIMIEKGKIQRFNNDDGGVKNIESKLTSFWGGLVTCARLVVMRRSRSQGRLCPMRLAQRLLFNFRKIKFYRRKRFYRKHAEIECC